MFSPRLVAQLGLTAAAVILFGSMSILLHGRESLKPRESIEEASRAAAVSHQVVFGEIGTAMPR